MSAFEIEFIILACCVRGYDFITDAVLLEICIQLRQNLAVTRPEQLELGLDAVAYECGSITDIADCLYIQLTFDDLSVHPGELIDALDIHFGQGLTVFDIRKVPCGTAEGNNIKDAAHGGFKLRINKALIADGEGAEMHAFGRIHINGADDILIDRFSHERRERCGKAAEGFKRGIERHICCFLIRSHLLAPVTLTTLTYIPVGQVVNEPVQLAPCFGDAEVFKIAVNGFNKGIEP